MRFNIFLLDIHNVAEKTVMKVKKKKMGSVPARFRVKETENAEAILPWRDHLVCHSLAYMTLYYSFNHLVPWFFSFIK